MQPDQKGPEVKLVSVIPISVEFTLNEAYSGAPSPQANYSIEVKGMISKDRQSSRVVIDVGVNRDDAAAAFRVRVAMRGDFSAANPDNPVEWEKFNKVNAPAIVFPFAREVISSMTSRVGMNILVPPINFVRLQEVAQEK